MAMKGSVGGGRGTHSRGGGLRSKDTINSQLGDRVNQSVVGDIDQEIEVV